mmetsp:Transcript_36693/g.86176  ORF Transcript_36693/g.86176 Transcript_36693/m.86176 type:complete len:241 (+) Transcript_36693:1447-2169(+)
MLVSSCGTTMEGERLSYEYTEDSTGGLRLGGDRANKYSVGWAAPCIVNMRTMAQPGVDAYKCRRRHDYALEKRFRGKAWATRIAMTLRGMTDVNVYLIWVRALGNKSDNMKEFFAQLSMEIISSADVTDAVCRSISTVQRTVAHTAPSPARRSSPRFVMVVEHEAVAYFQAGHAAGYQRRCKIYKAKASHRCSVYGEGCPIHPAQMRGGKTTDCLAQHVRTCQQRVSHATPGILIARHVF